jgi:hypothetical protein
MKKLIILLSILTTGLLYGDNCDFNHDGHQDYLLSNSTTRQLAIWHMNGLHLISGVYGPVLPAGWTIVGTGDFNHDGYPDLVLYYPPTHQSAIWYLRDGTFLGGAYGPIFQNGYVPKGVDDMDHDGNADLLAYNPNNHQLWAILMNGNQIRTPSQTTATTNVSFSKSLQPASYITDNSETMQPEAMAVTMPASVSTNSPQIGSAQYVLATLPFNWAVVESANHQITLINYSTFQTANWVIGFHNGQPNPFSIDFTFYGPNAPAGWQVMHGLDFNLDGWNDYLLGGAFGKNAQWYLNGIGHLVGAAYGPTIPTGFSFAKEGFKTCSFGVNPTSKTVPLTGGSFLVNVVTEFGCKWYYHSNTSWIHVPTTFQPQLGGGAIFVSVAPGPAGVGTITVANQTITINRGAGALTGHWTGFELITDGCQTHTILEDVHLVQSGNTLSGTWSVNGLPCPCGIGWDGFRWNDYGTLTGTVSSTGAITLHALGVTVPACGTSYHIDTDYTGQTNQFLPNSITLSQVGGLGSFQMTRVGP